MSVDPRTIAADIAAMRRDLSAPIRYSAEKRGYIYTDPAFKADIVMDGGDIPIVALGIAGLTALGMKDAILPLLPSSIVLSPWHRDILKTVVEKFRPSLKKGVKTEESVLGKISVVQGKPDFLSGTIEATVKTALTENTELNISYGQEGGTAADFLFRPLQLVYLQNEQKDNAGPIRCYVLGEMASGGGKPYSLLEAEHLQKADPTGNTFAPAKAVNISPVEENSIEVMLTRDTYDTILVFAAGENGTEYRLLSRIDIYAG
ncbi:hypothetical protein AGMMS49579_09290 [Spirochaetia bacterium]|nr:hypothetical protein AGMMS49579_09290 [Spirochaetia bacterium]